MELNEKLKRIADKAKSDKKLKFTSLIHLINESNLKESFKELKRGKASGVDGLSVEDYGKNLDENVKQLVERMKSHEYQPQPVKRVYIPKAGKQELRPLGLPSVEDKMVQLLLKKILEAIYEQDFLNCSYGFRPNRDCHQAIVKLNNEVMSKAINFVVEVDIKGFFDNVNHYWLNRCIEERISEKHLLELIRKFLKAGYFESGIIHKTGVGTPQGGIISPVLANIYLHYVLDLWFYIEFKAQAKGYVELIRYCDDFVIVCELEDDAETFMLVLDERLAKFGLEKSKDKTRKVKFGRQAWIDEKKNGNKVGSFDFLGFTHLCASTRKGYFMMLHKTSSKKITRKLKEIKLWLKSIRNLLTLKEWWKILKAKVQGHFNYFGISGNYRCLKQFYTAVIWLAFKWINRRSQKKSMTMEYFLRHYIKRNPLPLPKIYFSFYATWSKS